MTLDQIKTAISEGKKVCWNNSAYEVIKDSIGQYLILCPDNGSCVGLTWKDGVTLNGKETEFYTQEEITKQIQITWTIDCVQAQAGTMGISLNQRAAGAILDKLKKNYDPEQGITWETVALAIKEEQK